VSRGTTRLKLKNNLVVGCAASSTVSGAADNADVRMSRISSTGSRNAIMLWIDGALQVEEKGGRQD
jgi:hypothetical protein